MLLFVRDRPNNEVGAAPVLLLSEVDYVEHGGERPIAITWRLRRPMPGGVLPSGAAVAE